MITWKDQPLGEMPDQALADRLGVTRQAVQSARTARGISPYHAPITSPARESDAVVAAMADVCERLERIAEAMERLAQR